MYRIGKCVDSNSDKNSVWHVAWQMLSEITLRKCVLIKHITLNTF